MKYSLRHPPKGMPLLHVLLWQWIYAQIIALRLWVRKHYGRGVPYKLEVSPLGRGRLLCLPNDITWGHTTNAPLQGARFNFTTGIPRPALTLTLAEEDTRRAPAPVIRMGTIGALRALPQSPVLDST